MSKKNTLTVFLITLFLNMVISYLIGYRYKEVLTSYLSSGIYYQLVVFISLTLPLIVSWLYGVSQKKIIKIKVQSFKKKASKIPMESLDTQTVQMLNTIVQQDIPTAHEIKELYHQIEEFYK